MTEGELRAIAVTSADELEDLLKRLGYDLAKVRSSVAGGLCKTCNDSTPALDVCPKCGDCPTCHTPINCRVIESMAQIVGQWRGDDPTAI